MTPFLDGLCFFGGAVDTTQLGQRAIQSLDLPWETPLGTIATVRGFQSFELQGSTGRTARVWIDYLLYDNIDSLVAVVIQELGLRVTVENVEWYKRKILNGDVLNMSNEEVEAWIDAQQAEYRKMLIDKERQGRLRRRRSQQSAIANGLEEILQGEFVVSNHDFIEDDFIERNLKNMSAFPDQDSQLKRQISSDAQWLEDETLYGSSVPRKETPLERRKKENEDPETEESDKS
jgi:predicted transcriptional regulator